MSLSALRTSHQFTLSPLRMNDERRALSQMLLIIRGMPRLPFATLRMACREAGPAIAPAKCEPVHDILLNFIFVEWL